MTGERGVTRDELQTMKTELLAEISAQIDGNFAKLARVQKSEELAEWQRQLLAREAKVAADEAALADEKKGTQERLAYREGVAANIVLEEATLADVQGQIGQARDELTGLQADIDTLKAALRALRSELHAVTEEPA